jgi:hypothetical protein
MESASSSSLVCARQEECIGTEREQEKKEKVMMMMRLFFTMCEVTKANDKNCDSFKKEEVDSRTKRL